MTLTISPKLSWELIDFTTLIKGVEPNHRHFDTVRMRMWLAEHLSAGANPKDYSTNWDGWPSGLPGGGSRTDVWKYTGDLTIVYGGEYWTNIADLTYGDMLLADNVTPRLTRRPPEGPIHPEHNNQWILGNNWWKLAPDLNRYYHWDRNSQRWYAAANIHVYGDEFNPPEFYHYFHYSDYAHRLYSAQTDPKEVERPVHDISADVDFFQIRNKVEIDRHHITQPDSLGAIYSAWNYVKSNGSIQRYHHTTHEGDDPNESFSVPGNQYAHYEGDPGNTWDLETEARPRYKGGNVPGNLSTNNCQWTWDEKYCDGMQNRIERICCTGGWVWPTWNPNGSQSEQQTAFQTNWMARHDTAEPTDYPNGWSPIEYDAQPWFASIRDEMWGCNESGFEFILWLLGEFDWYFDVTFPHTSRQIVEWTIEEADANGWPAAYEKYPLPVGTWRRTWKYSFLKRYISGRRFQYMRQGSFNPSGQEWNGFGNATWAGLYVDTMPTFNLTQTEIDNLNDRHAPSQVEWKRTGTNPDVWESYPQYEIKAAMLIEMREVLIQLTYIRPQNISCVGAEESAVAGSAWFVEPQDAFDDGYTKWLAVWEPDPDKWAGWAVANWEPIGVENSITAHNFPPTKYVFGSHPARGFYKESVAFRLYDSEADEDDIYDFYTVCSEFYFKVMVKGIVATGTHPLTIGIGDYFVTIPTGDDTVIIGMIAFSPDEIFSAGKFWFEAILNDFEIPAIPAPGVTNFVLRWGEIKIATTVEYAFKINWDGFEDSVWGRDYTNHIDVP